MSSTQSSLMFYTKGIFFKPDVIKSSVVFIPKRFQSRMKIRRHDDLTHRDFVKTSGASHAPFFILNNLFPRLRWLLVKQHAGKTLPTFLIKLSGRWDLLLIPEVFENGQNFVRMAVDPVLHVVTALGNGHQMLPVPLLLKSFF